MIALLYGMGIILIIHVLFSMRWILFSMHIQKLLPQNTEATKEIAQDIFKKMSPIVPMSARNLQKQIKEWKGKISLDGHTSDIISMELAEKQIGLSISTGNQISIICAMFTIVIFVLHGQNPQLDTITEQIPMGITIFSMVLSILIPRVVTKAILRVQFTLEDIFPVLPKAEEATRDVMLQLHDQISQVHKSNSQTMAYMAKSQEILANLGSNLQFAFQKSVQEQLAPALQEVTKIAQSSQQTNQLYMEETSQKQGEIVQKMIADIMTGIDQAIGNSLRDTSESFASSVQKQQVSMDRWRRSVDSVSEVIGSLEEATKGITSGAAQMAMAAKPVEVAAEVFSQTAEKLQNIFPIISELSSIVSKSQEQLLTSHEAIRKGTTEYQQVSGSIKAMVQELQQTHLLAIQKVSQGIDEAVLQGLRSTSTEIQTIHNAQQSTLLAWEKSGNSINQTLNQLDSVSAKMVHFATNLEQAGKPTVEASKTFFATANKLGEIVEKLEETASIHTAGAQTMEILQQSLSAEKTRYNEATEKIKDIFETLDKTQDTMLHKFSQSLESNFGENLSKTQEKIVYSMEQASVGLQNSSQQLSSSLDNIRLSWEKTVSDSSVLWTETVKRSGDDIGVSIQKSSQNMYISLEQARQQLADSIGHTTRNLQISLQTAGQELIKDWAQTGDNIRDAISHASQSLDQSVQEVGRKLNIRVDEAGQSLEKSAKISAGAIETGAKNAQSVLSNVGGDWSSAIQSATNALQNSAQTAGEHLVKACDGMDGQIQLTLQKMHTTMLQSVTESMQKQQAIVEKTIQQHQQSSQQMLHSTEQSKELLQLSIQASDHALRESVTHFVQDLQTSLQDIFRQYEQSLLQASKQHNDAGQVLYDSAQKAGISLQQALQQSNTHIHNIMDTVGKQMVQNLEQVHNKYVDGLELSSSSLEQLASVQNTNLDGWTQLIASLEPALRHLQTSTNDLQKVMTGLQNSIEPTSRAAADFKQASSQIQAVFPNITDTANSYHQFNQSLTVATKSLTDTADKYSVAGSNMHSMLQGIQQTMTLQNTSNQAVSQTLTQVNQTIDALEPLVQLMQESSNNIRLVSEQTTASISTMEQATSAQNHTVQQMGTLSGQLLQTMNTQVTHLTQLTKQMEMLQKTLTVGVDAFAQTLPETVDKTLVNFDAALAEGVLRLGSSIERLREAMDDMIEQLDTMKK